MSSKSSIHIKPCNIAQSEAHNRRDKEYLRSLSPAKIYIREELSRQGCGPLREGVALIKKDTTLEDLLRFTFTRMKGITGTLMILNPGSPTFTPISSGTGWTMPPASHAN